MEFAQIELNYYDYIFQGAKGKVELYRYEAQDEIFTHIRLAFRDDIPRRGVMCLGSEICYWKDMPDCGG